MRNRFTATILLIAIAFATPLASSSRAQEGNQPGEQPVYFPHTKSYFSMMEIKHHPQWVVYERKAQTKSYRGVTGRLAIIRDKETHEFVKKTFGLNKPTWIRLRFFCRYRKLMWSDGSIHPLSDFKIWAKQWYRNKETNCGNPAQVWMPVYYIQTNIGPVWQASGQHKGFSFALIEYPTGKE